jgi:hypothetical protein
MLAALLLACAFAAPSSVPFDCGPPFSSFAVPWYALGMQMLCIIPSILTRRPCMARANQACIAACHMASCLIIHQVDPLQEFAPFAISAAPSGSSFITLRHTAHHAWDRGFSTEHAPFAITVQCQAACPTIYPTRYRSSWDRPEYQHTAAAPFAIMLMEFSAEQLMGFRFSAEQSPTRYVSTPRAIMHYGHPIHGCCCVAACLPALVPPPPQLSAAAVHAFRQDQRKVLRSKSILYLQAAWPHKSLRFLFPLPPTCILSVSGCLLACVAAICPIS